MQKISSYLYPNRILLTTDLAVHPTEYRIVYQRKFKIYKGLDNELLLDIKNADQKRIDVSNKTIKVVVMDELQQEVYTSTVVHSTTPGLATFTIPSIALTTLAPQFLNYTIYVENPNGSKTPVYGDTQFGVSGTFDFIGTAMPKALEPIIIDTFNYSEDQTVNPWVRVYTSEAAEVNFPNDISTVNTLSLEFWLDSLEAEIEVQLTEDIIVHAFTEWRTVETFNVATTTDRVSKVYNSIIDYSNNLGWLRIKYTHLNENTGTVDKVLVRR